MGPRALASGVGSPVVSAADSEPQSWRRPFLPSCSMSVGGEGADTQVPGPGRAGALCGQAAAAHLAAPSAPPGPPPRLPLRARPSLPPGFLPGQAEPAALAFSVQASPGRLAASHSQLPRFP